MKRGFYKMFVFKKYRSTKANVLLLEKAMKEVGYAVEKFEAVNDYQAFKSSNWHNMFHNAVNEKMQEIENR